MQIDIAWFAAVVASLGFLASAFWASRLQKRVDRLELRFDTFLNTAWMFKNSGTTRDGTLPLPKEEQPGTRMTELDERGRNPGVHVGRLGDGS